MLVTILTQSRIVPYFQASADRPHTNTGRTSSPLAASAPCRTDIPVIRHRGPTRFRADPSQ